MWMNDQLPAEILPSNRLLTAAEYQRLADVPPEIEWCTRRAYENAIQDFMRFTGINRLALRVAKSGSQQTRADDDEDCREDRPQHLVRHPRTQMAAEEDARQRANDERTQQYPIDRSQKPMAGACDQGQRHGMGDVGADKTRDRGARV